MRTPAEQAIYRAERPVYEAATRLDKAIAALAEIRRAIVIRLPLADAEAELDDFEDHLNIIESKLTAALAIHTTRIESLQLAEEVRYARAHGLTALAERAANDDTQPMKDAA